MAKAIAKVQRAHEDSRKTVSEVSASDLKVDLEGFALDLPWETKF